ncbi:DUF4365 domain-containing protein [bacterium]|nr:DUF4365 domain-containing protein [bacterium]
MITSDSVDFLKIIFDKGSTFKLVLNSILLERSSDFVETLSEGLSKALLEFNRLRGNRSINSEEEFPVAYSVPRANAPSDDFSLGELSNDGKERFSFAYINLIASFQNYLCREMPRIEDASGLDIEIIGKPREVYRTLYAQVKCTSRAAISQDSVKINLPIKDYDRLRTEEIPFILIVVLVPQSNIIEDLLEQLSENFQKACVLAIAKRDASSAK